MTCSYNNIQKQSDVNMKNCKNHIQIGLLIELSGKNEMLKQDSLDEDWDDAFAFFISHVSINISIKSMHFV